MPNILKSPAKVHAAKSFLNNFYDAGGADYIYIGLSDAGGEWSVPASPDVPLDSLNEEEDFWTNLIGMGKVSSANDTELVVPRKTWVTGTTYVAFNEATDTGSGTFDTGSGRNFYVCNTDVSPKVYICSVAGGGASTNEPSHSNPVGVAEADGYTWKYLYTIGGAGDVGASLLTTNWMPVPSSAVAYSNGMVTGLGKLALGDGSGNYAFDQIYQVTATTGNTNGANMNADTNNTWVRWVGDFQLGAFYVAASLAFPDYAGTGNQINNVAYRQVALLRNPLDNTGARITTQWKGSGFAAVVPRGTVLTMDNRVTITRAPGQTETVRLILEF